MRNILSEYVNNIYNKLQSLLSYKRQEIFFVITTTKPAPIFFNTEKILEDVDRIVKEKVKGPLSLFYKISDSKLTIAINTQKESTDTEECNDNFDSYLTQHHQTYFADLCDETEEMICLLEYSIPRDNIKNDILNLDLIRISPIIKGLGLEIEKLFHPYAAAHNYRYIVAYHIHSRIKKHFCLHGSRISLVSLPSELQSYLCDTPEMSSKCSVVLLDKITT